ncbi:hypothetical protein M0654_11220 [Rhizobium sp. NTR19]|uniref:PhiE125 gp8 family phage protein n=1 Tax=Neorhizobium turbinariae TaxID=2937795 RepID=A0ABT0IRP7_9HYPH|nr:hypothetical protein [Neorhizobium turbinariae]MCK8780556.1 hypothetical protein [Neorhizobium turbinariae]
MFRPVRVTAPASLPISVEDVKNALRVDGPDSNAEIERLIKAAVQHYEGWSGVLGIAIVEQTWRQDYGRFEEKMGLKVGPVTSIASVKYRNDQGQIATVAAGKYTLKHTGGGEAYVRFDRGFIAPVDLYEDAPVFIEYVAGWPAGEVPADIQTAIILRVQKHFDAAAQTNSDVLDRVEKDLTSRYMSVLV